MGNRSIMTPSKLLLVFVLSSFFFFFKLGLAVFPRLVLNSWAQVTPLEPAFLVVGMVGTNGRHHLTPGSSALSSTADYIARVWQNFILLLTNFMIREVACGLGSVMQHECPGLIPFLYFVFKSRQIECCETADEFYSTMGRLTQEMLENDLLQSHELMQVSGQCRQYRQCGQCGHCG